MAAIYFHVIIMVGFDLPIPAGYVEEKRSAVSRVFHNFFDNNQSKVMIISLIESKFVLK